MESRHSVPPTGSLLTRWRGWLILIPGICITCFVASLLYGTPAKLPGVALGFPVLLHLERAVAVLAVIAVVSIFAYMTSLGYLPNQLGNIGYSAVGRQHVLDRHVAELKQTIESRLRPLEQGQRASYQALTLIRRDLAELDRRLTALETKRDQ